MTTKKRFIAGAVCPRCAVMDRIFIYKQNRDTVRECYNCGYNDKLIAEDATKAMPTRVNRNEQGHIVNDFPSIDQNIPLKDASVDVIKMIDSKEK